MCSFIQVCLGVFLDPQKNAGSIVGLLIAFFALLVANISNYLTNRRVVRIMNARIEDLVSERNKYQKIVLGRKGVKRKSSRKTKK